MKATGIVRRIDDLGRIVIPLEIRRTLRIREGDPLEIYTEADGSLIFKKFSTLSTIEKYATHASDSLRMSGINAAIFDNFGDWVSGATSLKAHKETLINNLTERNLWKLPNANNVYCEPILSDGEIVGYIVFEYCAESVFAVVRLAATMLGLALSR